MNRAAILLAFALVPAIGRAQDRIVSLRVYTTIPGAAFYVDGQMHRTTASFLWPEGSKHEIRAALNLCDDPNLGPCYTFQSWRENTGKLTAAQDATQIVTAHRDVQWYEASFQANVLVRLEFNGIPPAPSGAPITCSGAPGMPPTVEGYPAGTIPGGVRTTGCGILPGCSLSSVQGFCARGSVISASAFPYPGYVFGGWIAPGGNPSFLTASVTVNGPTTIRGSFLPARRVIFRTDPPNLRIFVNRSPIATEDVTIPCMPEAQLCTGHMDFLPGSKLLLAAPDVQLDRVGVPWVLQAFDTGGGQNSTVTLNGVPGQDVIVAKFGRGVGASFSTNPPGLKVNINGRDNWPSYSFFWGVGSRNQISAPMEQTDSKGRKYVFTGWSNGGPSSQEIVPTELDLERGGIALAANYQVQGQVTIRSTHPVVIGVNGVDCPTPCTVHRNAGSEVFLAAPTSVSLNDETRADFAGWADGGDAGRTFVFDGESQNLQVTYSTMYKLHLASDPAGSVDFQTLPPTPDGYFAAGSEVVLTAEARPGFRFRRWAGDLSGVFPGSTFALNRPVRAIAQADRVPHISKAGVRNSAAQTPDALVAPGSLVSIFGESLSSDTVAGPSNPLAQTLDGVTVRLDSRILPLLFVSPQQINAQLPSELPEGAYKLTIRTSAGEEAKAEVTVAPNAPGVFLRPVGDQPFVLATRAGDAPVTAEAPARRGELITIYGTGFGPYERPVPDGFATPGSPDYPLVDKLEVVLGEQVWTPEWSGAAPGQVGIAITRVRVPEDAPSGQPLLLTIRVKGRSSNQFLLPVE
ncbi:MAG TPA: hypothetical protein DEH78_16385 [Solibacterales bacterium]|nr:hypothetical protein [Bryobacterales bacterium]